MNKHSAQGLIEFVFIIPLLILILFGIVELTLFLRTVNVVEIIATESAVAASRQKVDETQILTTYSDTDPTYNQAVKAAVETFLDRIKTLGLTYTINDFDCTVDTNYGDTPYSKYTFKSKSSSIPKKDVNGVLTDVLVMNIDYTNPYKKGVIIDFSYVYSTLFIGAEFSLPGVNQKVVILPKTLEIKSVPVQQYINY